MWGLIFYVWIILAIWQIVVGAFLVRKTNRWLVDGGWAGGRLAGWLFVSLIVWFGGHLKLPINTLWGVRIVTAIMTAVGGWQLMTHRKEIKKILWEKKWLILTEEILFAVGLTWLVWVRSHNGDILDLEKFMDAGFIQGYLRSPTLPAIDMWLAGEKINYYTFGHFMGAILTQVWGVDMVYSYNLLLGVIMGLTLTLSFSVVVNLIQTFTPGESGRANALPATPGVFHTIVGGIMGAMLMGFGGNMHTIWFWIKNLPAGRQVNPWQGYWYADATRFIYNTIHEFPAYSFVVSDLHGHVWDLPVVLLFLVCLVGWYKSWQTPPGSRLTWSVVLGVLLGVMVMTNTWDALIYGMLVGVVGLFMIMKNKFKEESLPTAKMKGILLKFFSGSHPVFMPWAVMVIAMVVVALPWKLNFTSIDQGVRLVTTRSPLWQLVVLWSGHITIIAIAMLLNTKIQITHYKQVFKSKIQISNILVLAMAVSAVILLIIPEFVYVKDIYPNHPRANTMFKLTYQAFVMMSILIGWVSGTIKMNSGRVPPFGARPDGLFSGTHPKFTIPGVSVLFVLVLITGGLLTFPYFAYRDYYGGLKTIKGIDGLAWLARGNLDDYQAILWMKQNIKGHPTDSAVRPVILEAVGESYTQHGRFSVFTGLPTVLGWRVHEWLWRGGFEIPGQRTEEVKEMYEKPTSDAAKELFGKYKIKYIVVGSLERAGYKISEKEIKKLGEVVFKSGLTEVIKIAD